jgi:hypothetical protein
MGTSAVAVEREVRAARYRFVATIFVGSFLLFLVQPMVARMALPRLGGAPAVWNSAMLVYQALLLAGYAYAHWLGRAGPRRQAAIHLVVFALAALTLPIGLIASFPPPDANPFLWVPWLLLVSIGPLFFVISAQAPLIQRWYALAGAGDPYPLYAASNLGSFAGLLAYPLMVEPLLPIAEQRWWWSAAYCLLALFVAWCAFSLPAKSAAEAPKANSPAPAWRERLAWILIASVPSGLILSTTLHLTTDIGAMPLLWVLPLGVYLLSFTVAFASKRGAANMISRIAPLILLFAACGLFVEVKSFALLFGAVAILNLFTVSVALHSQLFDRRPDPQHLTLFYLMLSVGGVIGGIFCALVAPMVFDWTYEHVILLVAAAALMTTPSLFDRVARLWNGDSTDRRVTRIAIALLIVLALVGKGVFLVPASKDVAYYAMFAIIAVAIVAIGNRLLFTVAVAALMINVGGWERLGLSLEPGKMTRSFFGVYSVQNKGDGARMLVHGTTLHGVQNLGSPARERMGTTYYAPQSGVGLAMAAAPRMFGGQARVGIVGLGAGTLACYARPGQRWTFYEIDPVDIDIARDPKQFTFLSRCLPGVPVELGDARLTLERAPPKAADLLVIDAFSSDSIPIHLLTREAFSAYRRHLSDGGLLMVHISNRFLDLEPVMAAAAAQGWHARLRYYRPDEVGEAYNHTASIWVAMSPSPETLSQLVSADRASWRPIRERPGFTPWTDDHATLLPLIRWRA